MASLFERTGRPPHPDILTPAEWEVLAAVREGMTNGEVAQRRGCSVETVRFHLRNVRSKLGVTSRSGLRDFPGQPQALVAGRAAAQRTWRIQEQIPLIAVRDMAAMLDFYTGVLGLQMLARWPDAPELPGWCALGIGAARLMLHAGHHRRDLEEIRPGGPITMSLYLSGLDALHEELVCGGLVVSPIEQQFYGARECFLRDPEGNELNLVEFPASAPGYTAEETTGEPT